MDRMMQLTRYQVEKMKQEKDRFYLLDDDPQCVNVCFWYIPERLRKSEHTKQKEIELGVVRIPSLWMSFQRKSSVVYHVMLMSYIIFFVNFKGYGKTKEHHDGSRNTNGELPTSWRIAKLLSKYYFKCSIKRGRYWLHVEWNGKIGKTPLGELSKCYSKEKY